MASGRDKPRRRRRTVRALARRNSTEETHRRRRLAMVDEQIRGRGVTDSRVLGAMESVPRHLFVAESLAATAYRDHPLPIAADQTISQPYMVALMAQAALIASTDRVLEVGTGSGYGAAVLSKLAAEVVTVERHRELADTAAGLLAALGCRNVTVAQTDGSLGYAQRAPYAAVLVTASTPTIPDPLVEQLAEEGRLIIPLGPLGEVQQLTRLRRTGHTTTTENLGAVRFVPLVADH